MLAHAPNSVSDQYIPLVAESPKSKRTAPAPVIPRAAAAASRGDFVLTSQVTTILFVSKFTPKSPGTSRDLKKVSGCIYFVHGPPS